MKSIKKIAYEKYQKDWLLSHGYSLNDLKPASKVDIPSFFEECNDRGNSYEAFLEIEYMNPAYMESILSEEEYLRYYTDYLKSYKKKYKKRYITTKIDSNVIAVSFCLDVKLTHENNKLWPAVKTIYEQEYLIK